MKGVVPADETSISGRCVLISGGGRGIGRAVAERFADAGALVHIIARSGQVHQAAADMNFRGRKVWAYQGSVGDEDFCRATVAHIEAAHGHVDILVNAAAVHGEFGPLVELNMKAFSEALVTNVMGTCNLMRWTIPAMQKAGFGRVVNFAGGGAAYSYPLFSPYVASKVAIVRLTETIADEVKDLNVTINVITPGSVKTEMQKEVIRRGAEIRTVTDISEPVELIVYLSTPEAKHIDGRFIHVRDDYRNPDLYRDENMLKLRRTERR